MTPSAIFSANQRCRSPESFSIRSYPQNIVRTVKYMGFRARPRGKPEAGRNRFAGKRDQTACKPGSVPPALLRTRRPFLWTARCRTVLATYPDASGLRQPYQPESWRDVPIRSCSKRGLPCRPGHPVRGGLLPHPFTLTGLRGARRFAFCGAIPRVTPGGRYPPPCRRGARTFLPSPCGKGRPPGRLIAATGGRSRAWRQAGGRRSGLCAPSVSPLWRSATSPASPSARMGGESVPDLPPPPCIKAERGRWRGASGDLTVGAQVRRSGS